MNLICFKVVFKTLTHTRERERERESESVCVCVCCENTETQLANGLFVGSHYKHKYPKNNELGSYNEKIAEI